MPLQHSIAMRVLKTLCQTMALLLAAGWFMLHFAITSAPRTPVPETGNVIVFNNHGTMLYITAWEDALLYILPAALCGLIVVGRALGKHPSQSDKPLDPAHYRKLWERLQRNR
jgi:hypothetical protein